MFLCREEELSKLNSRYNGDSMECVVIYGRRRVGKTSLINEFCKDKPKIYFPALNSNAQDNLAALSKAIYLFEHPDAQEAPVFPSFDAAFSEVTRLVTNGRVIFVIDELSYLADTDSSVLSRLQHLLDHEWADTKLFMILCGSSVSFMEKGVLSEKSPLFGRRTMQLHIKPLSYFDTAKFNPKLSAAENALIYGITGGVPHYINKLNVKGSIKKALLENFFDTSSYLYEEPINLLKQELREPAVYNSIIAAIADGKTRMSSIAEAVHMDTSACAQYIKTLVELGIIKRTEPIVDKSKKKVQYLIADNLFRFWYRFVPRNMMAISSGNMELIYDSAVGSYLSEYMGLVFEDICRQYLAMHAARLPVIPGEIGEWWGNDSIKKKECQLDIVALEVKAGNIKSGRKFIIGSCKYTNDKIGVDELELLREYAAVFTNANDECWYYIFSKGGFTDALKEQTGFERLTLVSIEELY